MAPANKISGLILVAAAVAGIWGYGTYERSVGRLQATIRAQDLVLDSLRKRKVLADTIYRQDTVRLTRWRVQYKTLSDTVLEHLTDTVRVKEFVRVADSTIAACSAVVLSCEARVAVRDTLITTLQDQLKTERGRNFLPLFHVKLPSRMTSLGLGLGAGLAAGLLLRR